MKRQETDQLLVIIAFMLLVTFLSACAPQGHISGDPAPAPTPVPTPAPTPAPVTSSPPFSFAPPPQPPPTLTYPAAPWQCQNGGVVLQHGSSYIVICNAVQDSQE